MVSRAVRFALAVFLLACSVRADLQLKPEVAEYELDGTKLRRLVFSDGSDRVTYTPPGGWEYSGSGNRFLLHPPRESRAEATISLIKLAAPEVFDDATMKRLSEEVLASVPSNAMHITIVSQQKNPLLIERKETFLVVVNYDCYGDPYARSVMFLNRKNEQVRFQLTCPRSVFPELQKVFQSSHYSWQNL